MRRFLALAVGLIVVVPAFAGKVSFRDDRTILVDGKPFFPIGLYYCSEEFEDKSGRRLQDLRTFGFNSAGYYRWGTPDWQEELARADRAGFKVWIRGHQGFALTSPELEKAAVEQVKQTRGQPALLFWEFEDEPLLNKVPIEGARKGYATVKREDPDHPLLLVEWPGAANRFSEWRGIGDIFATDLYPIPRSKGYGQLPNKDITQMRDYLAALRQGYGDKPLLLVLQAWAWDPLKDGAKGYPTPAESRFMAYQAVIHGAKGLHYYGQLHCTKPNSAAALDGTAKDPAARKSEFEKCLALNRRFWEQHRPFFRELSQASAIFTLPGAKPAQQVRLVGDVAKEGGIEHVTRQSGDHQVYVLAVNASAQRRDATFRLPEGVKPHEIHTHFEAGRKVAVKDGSFVDRFEPYGVHVYATTAALP